MNGIDGSDRHVSTVEGIAWKPSANLPQLTFLSPAAFTSRHRFRYQPSRLGTPVLDALSLGRPC
jgi:hypothetical protein